MSCPRLVVNRIDSPSISAPSSALPGLRTGGASSSPPNAPGWRAPERCGEYRLTHRRPAASRNRCRELASRAIVPAIARRGRLLAYQEYLVDTNLWRASTTGPSSPERVISSTREDTLPVYSPDGARIAFSSNRSGNWEIWIANADGSDARQLTSYANAPACSPRWSPNGQLLAFGHVDEGNGDIYTMTPEGSAIRPPDSGAVWRGNAILVPRRPLALLLLESLGHVRDLEARDRSAVQVIQVTRGGGTNPVESPDGKQLFYKKGGRTALEIWTTPVSGGESPVCSVPSRVPWLVPGCRIRTASTSSSRPGGSPITSLRPAAQSRSSRSPRTRWSEIPALTLSPDGRWLLFAQRDRSGSDIMLVENFR